MSAKKRNNSPHEEEEMWSIDNASGMSLDEFIAKHGGKTIGESLAEQAREAEKLASGEEDWDDEEFEVENFLDDDWEEDEFTLEDWRKEQEAKTQLAHSATQNPLGTDSEKMGKQILNQRSDSTQHSHSFEKRKKTEPITIIAETENWVAVNKPPYVPSLPERGKYTAESVMEWARKRWPDSTLCHRIDRETSGVLLVAKHLEAFRHFAQQFEHRKVRKTYHAIANHQLHFKDFWVDLPIFAEQVGKIRIDRNHGKPAQTRFNTLTVFRHYTLLECEPKTGRLHQIRVHLQSQNASIAGDILYKSDIPYLSKIKKKLHGEDTPLIQRFALHARELELLDLDQSPLKITAEYPKDFAVFLKLLNKYDI
ncbi:MAG: RluA family pseudouridine synthase [Bacteroidota bacterium]|jgi:23S rRNA pseudouridine955/2504/2580 synthase